MFRLIGSPLVRKFCCGCLPSIIDVSDCPCTTQETYQQTHPVLFSDRAIYVIVYSLRTGVNQSELTKHLMNVTVRCNDAPIVLVGTHSDVIGGDPNLPLVALKAKFPQVCRLSPLVGMYLEAVGNLDLRTACSCADREHQRHSVVQRHWGWRCLIHSAGCCHRHGHAPCQPNRTQGVRGPGQ